MVKRNYQLKFESTFWHPGNYEDKFSINIESEDKDFIGFMDNKIIDLIDEFKLYKKNKKGVKDND